MLAYRLEAIACAIQQTVQKKKAIARGQMRLAPPPEAYAHFRQRAFKVLSYYIENDLQAAFGWLLVIYEKHPKRSRGSVRGNDFHLGLLAMTAAAGRFLHPNKLRDLALLMQQARSGGVTATEFEGFRLTVLKKARHDRVNWER